MNDVEGLFAAVVIGATGCAFAIFMIGTATRRQPAPASETDFGVVFSAFLAAWLATEIFEVVAPAEIREAGALAHLLLLSTVAVWLNARFRATLLLAREES